MIMDQVINIFRLMLTILIGILGIVVAKQQHKFLRFAGDFCLVVLSTMAGMEVMDTINGVTSNADYALTLAAAAFTLIEFLFMVGILWRRYQ